MEEQHTCGTSAWQLVTNSYSLSLSHTHTHTHTHNFPLTRSTHLLHGRAHVWNQRVASRGRSKRLWAQQKRHHTSGGQAAVLSRGHELAGALKHVRCIDQAPRHLALHVHVDGCVHGFLTSARAVCYVCIHSWQQTKCTAIFTHKPRI